LKSQRVMLLLQDKWREGAFTCTHTLIVACTSLNCFAVLAGHLCEFHTKQWMEHCSVPVGCLPHTFLQSIVCRSAVDSLKSWRAVLLLQDRQREGVFTFFLATSFWDCYHFFYHIRQPYHEGLFFYVEARVQYCCSVLKVCSSEYSQTHTLRRLNTFRQHCTW
jgi:hypothetical protein